MIGLGVPHAVVNAVDNAPQLAAVIAKMGVQRFAVFPGLDFPGIGVADGGDAVGVGQAALEQVGVLVLLLEGAHVEDIVWKPRPVFDGGNVVDPLEAQIVDGEDGLGARHRRALEQGAQVYRHQRRLPVMAVDDVGNPVHVVQRCQGSLAEEAILGNVVDQVYVGVAQGEELLVVDEVIDHAVPDVLHDAHIEVPTGVAEIHVEFASVDHLVLVFLGNAGIAGENDADVAVEPYQLPGQGVHHVAQATSLDEGMALRTDERHTPAGQIGIDRA